MNPRQALTQRDGVARTETLKRLGVSRHALRSSVQRGDVIAVRRGWVALPDADPMLVAAARRGVFLSCVTLAARKGLWVLDAAQPHVAAPARSGHVKLPRGTVHWNEPVFPRDPDSREDSLENALILVAGCQPYESALATWESAMRQSLIAPGILERAPLPPAARRLLADARQFADSGTESIFQVRLRWLGIPVVPQVWILGHRVDFVIGERLVVQIDGGHHVGEQRTSDIAHDALLTLHGYHVIRIGYGQLIGHWAQVQQVILTAIGQRLHLAE
ncbi:DUF559 domain-containing protein [Microbacterium sp. APC 3901]|uniref:DUF559 domain-containing protein n=1 Tax=Microbacterium sp. APC 3901 TaxID=3035192 RepID=UPI0025B4639B|nr:DUF559 domain-containing protein [Microbacterium sp. APC 3901]MDN3446016.1 DUF559 domain-containing protein [Microbacterium sp. APC 3901]